MQITSKRKRSIKSNRKGVAAVEFAIVAPLLLLMIFMMVEASRFLSSLHATAGAAREVARLIAVNGVDISTAEEHARLVMENSLFRSDSVTVTVDNAPSLVPDASIITVTVTIDFSDVSVIGDPFNIGVVDVRGTSSRLVETARP